MGRITPPRLEERDGVWPRAFRVVTPSERSESRGLAVRCKVVTPSGVEGSRRAL